MPAVYFKHELQTGLPLSHLTLLFLHVSLGDVAVAFADVSVAIAGVAVATVDDELITVGCEGGGLPRTGDVSAGVLDADESEPSIFGTIVYFDLLSALQFGCNFFIVV
ncbi:unnamed protein product [[Candida] boidinii]|nr:unnamed protein product [[Candida] boidinii]GMG18519.1 unnamed protein product [[Candida] boidinii]